MNTAGKDDETGRTIDSFPGNIFLDGIGIDERKLDSAARDATDEFGGTSSATILRPPTRRPMFPPPFIPLSAETAIVTAGFNPHE